MSDQIPHIQALAIGLPGKVSTVIATAVDKAGDMSLMPYALTGNIPDKSVKIGDREIDLIKPAEHGDYLEAASHLRNVVAFEFTESAAVNRNVRLLCSYGISSVVGTTGGDRGGLEETVRHSSVHSVIAPNMNPALVVVHAMLEYAAETFPGALDGFVGQLIESHQADKKGPSGTGIAWKALLETLGVDFPYGMKSVRDREDGHGHHFITLEKGGVEIDLTTKVEGRVGYDDGALMAIRYVARATRDPTLTTGVHSMINVLEAAV